MSEKLATYKFTGFGFDVLLHDVEIKEAHGEQYPDINIKKVKLLTAKELLKSRERLTGKKLKFLRTFLNLSYQNLTEIIDVPASTLRSWEDKGDEATNLTAPQERQFRVYAIESILNMERKHIEKQIVMTETYELPTQDTPLDLGAGQDYSYIRGA